MITCTEGGRRLRDSRNTPPLVSIITVLFRAADELPALIANITPHLGSEVEWIVIDGGSGDGTVSLLEEHGDRIDYWMSEPDHGVYDAMNKGVAEARGEYVLHLNAGDRLLTIPFAELRECHGVDLVSFSVDMEGFGIFRPRPGLFLSRFYMPWHHQGCFYRREGHLGYDTRFPVHADFDLNQRMVLANKSVRCFDILVSKMGGGGASAGESTKAESYRIIRKNFGPHYALLTFLWYNTVCPLIALLQRLLGRQHSSKPAQDSPTLLTAL